MTDSGVAQQIGAIRSRLIRLRDRIQAEPISNLDLQRQILDELQSALEVLQISQEAFDQPTEQRPPIEPAQTQREDRLRASLQERDVLLRETHHRVKNNLQIVSSLLDIQAMQAEDAETRELLRTNQSRISLIALFHETIQQSQTLTEINFTEYVRNLAITVFRIYAIDSSRIALRVEANSEIIVNPDRAIPAALILNELISNALKHGFQETSIGEIVVSLEDSSEGRITLTVGNSGSNLPADFNLSRLDFLGLQLVQSLVHQVEGTLEVESSDQTTFRLTFDNPISELSS
jgi:two-component sensor histidine kinase